METEFRKIQNISGTLYVSIPTEWAKELKLQPGKTIRLDLVKNKIIASPVSVEEFLNLGFEKEGEAMA